MLRVGSPSVKEGIGRDIFVDAHLICEGVVFVAFITPPSCAQSCAKAYKVAHTIAELVHAMDVVMSEPAGIGHCQRQKESTQGSDSMRSGSGTGNQTNPNRQKLSLMNKVTLPPPIGLELIPKLSKCNLGRGIIRHLLGKDLHGFRG